MGTPINWITVSMTAIAIYLLWMDLGLYQELQKLPVRRSSLFLPTNITPEPYVYSPFKPVTVKLLVLPATIQFLDEPMGYCTVKYTDVAEYFSPNTVSVMGVFIALLSAKFFVSESLKYRQIGVLLFKVRDFMDALDGNIAREISSSHAAGQVANPASWGWMVDGMCDGLADIIRFLAFTFYLKKVLSNGKCTGGSSYHLLDAKIDICSRIPLENMIKPGGWRSRVYQLWIQFRKPMEIVLLVGLQSLFSSVLWNYFMINYHVVLETDMQDTFTESLNYRALATTQNTLLKSSAMWIICYGWRLVNPQTITQIQLLAVLYGKEVELLTSVQILGYLPPAFVGLLSYIHLTYTTSIVSTAALS